MHLPVSVSSILTRPGGRGTPPTDHSPSSSLLQYSPSFTGHKETLGSTPPQPLWENTRNNGWLNLTSTLNGQRFWKGNIPGILLHLDLEHPTVCLGKQWRRVLRIAYFSAPSIPCAKKAKWGALLAPSKAYICPWYGFLPLVERLCIDHTAGSHCAQPGVELLMTLICWVGRNVLTHLPGYNTVPSDEPVD